MLTSRSVSEGRCRSGSSYRNCMPLHQRSRFRLCLVHGACGFLLFGLPCVAQRGEKDCNGTGSLGIPNLGSGFQEFCHSGLLDNLKFLPPEIPGRNPLSNERSQVTTYPSWFAVQVCFCKEIFSCFLHPTVSLTLSRHFAEYGDTLRRLEMLTHSARCN